MIIPFNRNPVVLPDSYRLQKYICQS